MTKIVAKIELLVHLYETLRKLSAVMWMLHHWLKQSSKCWIKHKQRIGYSPRWFKCERRQHHKDTSSKKQPTCTGGIQEHVLCSVFSVADIAFRRAAHVCRFFVIFGENPFRITNKEHNKQNKVSKQYSFWKFCVFFANIFGCMIFCGLRKKTLTACGFLCTIRNHWFDSWMTKSQPKRCAVVLYFGKEVQKQDAHRRHRNRRNIASVREYNSSTGNKIWQLLSQKTTGGNGKTTSAKCQTKMEVCNADPNAVNEELAALTQTK